MLMTQKRSPRKNSFLQMLLQHLFLGWHSLQSSPLALQKELAKLLSSSRH